jgi:hypothetical protein
MLKCSVSMEEKEGRRRGCYFESDGEQEVEMGEAWTKWAFSVFRRPGQSLEIRWEGLTTRGVLVKFSSDSERPMLAL